MGGPRAQSAAAPAAAQRPSTQEAVRVRVETVRLAVRAVVAAGTAVSSALNGPLPAWTAPQQTNERRGGRRSANRDRKH